MISTGPSESVILTFRAVPAGKPAIETSVPVAVGAFFPGCQNKHAPGTIAVSTTNTFAVGTGGRFIFFRVFFHF